MVLASFAGCDRGCLPVLTAMTAPGLGSLFVRTGLTAVAGAELMPTTGFEEVLTAVAAGQATASGPRARGVAALPGVPHCVAMTTGTALRHTRIGDPALF